MNQITKLFSGNMGRQRGNKRGCMLILISIGIAAMTMFRRNGNKENSIKSVVFNEHKKDSLPLPFELLATEFANELFPGRNKNETNTKGNKE